MERKLRSYHTGPPMIKTLDGTMLAMVDNSGSHLREQKNI
jgi:hypothetical protein